MSTLTRKQREIREREGRLLGIARQMLIEQGFAGLSMDRLADAAEYSKGTLYQHFSTKEDLVTALAIESMERRVELFHRALEFRGRPREKMLAIGVADELFSLRDPHHYRSEFVIKLASLRERASPERRETLAQLEQDCFGPIVGIVQSAIELRDLVLPSPAAVHSLVYSVVTMALGTHLSVLNDCPVANALGITDPISVLRDNLLTLFDGFGWKPLRAEWDYTATYHRIRSEIFHDDFATLPAH